MPASRSCGRLIALALLVALASLCRAEDPGERLVYAWDFAEATDALGWEALQSVAPLSVAGGALAVRATGADPYIQGPELDATIPAGLLVRVTLRSSVAGDAELFWAAAPPGERASYRASDEIRFPLEADTAWRTVTVVPTWRPGDHLSRLRFDAPEGMGGTVEIRRVEIVERPVPEDLPTTPRYDLTDARLALAFLPGPGVEHAFGQDGALLCEVAADPATLFSPPFALEAADAGICTLELRADADMGIDVQFLRAGLPLWPPAECVHLPLAASRDFRVVNLDLRTHKAYQGPIERLALRISAPAGAKLELRGLAIAASPSGPAALDLLECRAPGVVSALGPTLETTCVITNRGGTGSVESDLTAATTPSVTGTAPVSARVPALRPLETTTIRVPLPIDRAFTGGELAVRVALASGGERTIRTVVVPIPSPGLLTGAPGHVVDAFFHEAGHAVLRNGLVTLVFPRGGEVFGTGVLLDTTKPEPVRVGSFPSLGRVEGETGTFAMRTGTHPVAASGPDSAELLFPVSVRVGEQERTGRVRFLLEAGKPDVFCELRLDAGPDLPLAGLLFPDFLAGDGGPGVDREVGVFPGLEYLLPGEHSSGLEFAAPPGHRRIAPHPYRSTLPAMWVTSRETTVGMWWDPLQEWAPGASTPAPVFSSPDELTGSPAHRFGLLVPGALAGQPENALGGPAAASAGEEAVRVGATVFVVHGRDVEPPIRHVLEALSGKESAVLPALPSPAPELPTILERAAAGFARTLWMPQDRWWHPNLPDAHGPRYVPAYADVLWCYARGYPEGPVAAEAGAVYDQALAAQRERGQAVGVEVAMHESGLLTELRGMRAHGRGLARRVRPDGSVAFVPGTPLRSAFGIEGDSSSGETGSVAVTLLMVGSQTMDAETIRAGLAALEYLKTQARPEGAQVWELPLHVPDVLAAAYCVRAFALAYELTGDPVYLGQARTWAFRSLPFVYLWSPPERPIMRYGSIPVFGATHYQGGWFGRIVQWNGLVLAEALLELAPLDESFAWETVARGIVLSGGQQMRPLDPATSPLAREVPDCGHEGLYPDSYSAVDGTDAYHWCIESSPLGLISARLLGRGGVLTTRVVREGPAVASLSSLAAIGSATVTAEGLEAELSLAPGYGPHTVLVAGFGVPGAVRVGGAEVPSVGDLDSSAEPLCYARDAETGLLLVRLAPSDQPVRLSVVGPVEGSVR